MGARSGAARASARGANTGPGPVIGRTAHDDAGAAEGVGDVHGAGVVPEKQIGIGEERDEGGEVGGRGAADRGREGGGEDFVAVDPGDVAVAGEAGGGFGEALERPAGERLIGPGVNHDVRTVGRWRGRASRRGGRDRAGEAMRASRCSRGRRRVRGPWPSASSRRGGRRRWRMHASGWATGACAMRAPTRRRAPLWRARRWAALLWSKLTRQASGRRRRRRGPRSSAGAPGIEARAAR